MIDDAKSLDTIREQLDRPDFVIIKGSHYDDLIKRLQGNLAPSPLRSIVESVVITGEVLTDQAHLTFDMRVSVTGEEPAWVPIRLEGKVPTSAREGDRELPLRVVDGSWQVQVQGEGAHQVKVTLHARVLPATGSPEGRRLEWAIPEAATTRIQLIVGADVTDIEAVGGTGLRAPLFLEPVEGGQRLRASASLAPHKRIELTWRVASEKNAVVGPPLLTSQGEISLEVERGSMKARSSWEVRSERGTVRQLEFRLDQADELLGLECDGRPIIAEGPADSGSGTVIVPLLEPLRPGGVTRLSVTTRRALAPERTSRLTYRGVPLVGVVGQSGVVAISQAGGDTWVSATGGRGLKQIDPRSDLPASLRGKPFTVLAFQFVELPFDLALQVDPSSPWVQVKSRATMTVSSGRARIDHWLDYNVPRGRIFEVRITLPSTMTLDLVGPQSTVASSERLANVPGSIPGNTFVARLTPRASEDGFFSIHLAGWQEIPIQGEFEVGLPQPQDAQSRGGLLALLADRNLSVEPNVDPDAADGFHPANFEPPLNWPWPVDRGSGSSPVALWLRFDDNPSKLLLKTLSRPRTIQELTTIEAQIEPRRLDVRQETNLEVHHGTIESFEVTIPSELENSWEVEGAEILRSESVETTEAGLSRFRLTLAREVVDRCQLGFHIRQDFASALDDKKMRQLRLPRVVVEGVVSEPPRYRVSAEERIELKPVGTGWIEVTDDTIASPRRFVAPVRFEHTGDSPAIIEARAYGLAALPRLVCSRLWMVTAMDAAGSLRTTASYRVDVHDGAFVVALPPGAVWQKARVGGEIVTEVETIDQPSNAYRLKLTAGSTTPILVSLEYVHPSGLQARWGAPRLLSGGVVQDCFWEARIPWHLALIGSPPGWSDANRWVWSLYAFMKQPSLSPSRLETWVGSSTIADPSRETNESNALHSYLFARVGDPIDIQPNIVTRAALVGSCSGIVMFLGLGLILIKAWSRIAWIALPVVALGVAALTPANVLLVVVQSSILGFILAGLAAMTQRLVERRPPHSSGFVQPLDLAPSTGSSNAGRLENPSLSLSEESTVIRNRSGTTIDHAPASSSLSDRSSTS